MFVICVVCCRGCAACMLECGGLQMGGVLQWLACVCIYRQQQQPLPEPGKPVEGCWFCLSSDQVG
jgi:hypothetical protein